MSYLRNIDAEMKAMLLAEQATPQIPPSTEYQEEIRPVVHAALALGKTKGMVWISGLYSIPLLMEVYNNLALPVKWRLLGQKEERHIVKITIRDIYDFEPVGELMRNGASKEEIEEALSKVSPVQIHSSFDDTYIVTEEDKKDANTKDITDDFIERLKQAAKEMMSWKGLRNELRNLSFPAIIPRFFTESEIQGKLSRIDQKDLDRIPKSVIDELEENPGSFLFFRDRVGPRKEWDLKNNVYKHHKDSGILIQGKLYGNDVPGNILYGYAGAAGGFSERTLKEFAGLAQKNAGTNGQDEVQRNTQYDDPRDQAAIQVGINLFQHFGTNLTPDNLYEAMRYL